MFVRFTGYHSSNLISELIKLSFYIFITCWRTIMLYALLVRVVVVKDPVVVFVLRWNWLTTGSCKNFPLRVSSSQFCRSQYWPELFQMLSQTSTTPVHQPLILRANSAKMAVDKVCFILLPPSLYWKKKYCYSGNPFQILRQPNNAVINVLLKLASGSGGLFTFDSVCASFCADGNLTYFSSKLAM